MSDEQKELFNLLKTAVDKVYSNDRDLLENEKRKSRSGLEQAFVFRVGIYLNELLKKSNYKHLNLDCEYNKNGDDSKRTEKFPKGIKPDLLLHKRQQNDKNKLAVEFKGYWNNRQKSIQKDKQKLEDLTFRDGHYKYKLGVFVIIGKDEASFTCFVDGEEVNCDE